MGFHWNVEMKIILFITVAVQICLNSLILHCVRLWKGMFARITSRGPRRWRDRRFIYWSWKMWHVFLWHFYIFSYFSLAFPVIVCDLCHCVKQNIKIPTPKTCRWGACPHCPRLVTPLPMCAVRPHIPYIVSTSTFLYFDGKNILPWVATSSWEGV